MVEVKALLLLKGALKVAKKWLIRGIIFFFVSSILSVILLRFLPIPVTTFIVYQSFERVFDGGKMGYTKKWVSIDKMSKHIQHAVIAAEDQRFVQHYGFDFEGIGQVIKGMNQSRAVKRGASTITQQTAKNVYLWPTRSWIRKGIEAYFTILLEIFWSKKRILEVYLNVVETGKGLYGVEAAAQFYFKKPASKLTAYEAARIAACLPNPKIYKIGKPGRYVLQRQANILYWMNVLSPEYYP